MRAALREHCSTGAARHRSISYNAAKNGRRETLLIYCERRRCAQFIVVAKRVAIVSFNMHVRARG
jgi:hypothetical protein